MHYLLPQGVIWLEVGRGQAPKIKQIFQNQGFLSIKSFFDLEKHERIIRIQVK